MIRSRCSDRLIRRWKMKRPVSLDGERMARNAGHGIADRIGPARREGLPVICPRCRTLPQGRQNHPCRRTSLHGVVFDI